MNCRLDERRTKVADQAVNLDPQELSGARERATARECLIEIQPLVAQKYVSRRCKCRCLVSANQEVRRLPRAAIHSRNTVALRSWPGPRLATTLSRLRHAPTILVSTPGLQE